MRKHPKSNAERGAYLVVVVVFSVLVLSFAALVIGLGTIMTNDNRLQNLTNIGALSALEGYMSSRENSYGDRAQDGLDRVEEIIVQNDQNNFLAFDLSDETDPDVGLAVKGITGSAGMLEYGNWLVEAPPSGPDCGPTPADYPCFVPDTSAEGTSPAPPVTAARLTLQNDSSLGNLLVAPFTRFFGRDSFQLARQAIVSVVPRCAVFLIDISRSVSYETHRSDSIIEGFDPLGDPQEIVVEPANPALFVWDPTAIDYGSEDCTGSTVNNAQGLFWCNLPRESGSFVLRDTYSAGAALLPNQHDIAAVNDRPHFIDDFELRDVPFDVGADGNPGNDQLLVETLVDPANDYLGPEPFTRFFLSFNAGLRAVERARSSSDRAAIIPFSGIVRDQVPSANVGLTNDFPLLIQLTNLMNRGTRNPAGGPVSAQVNPNFVDRGWLPVFSTDSRAAYTNLNRALETAMDALATCPANGVKSIVLASDGLGVCHHDPADPAADPDGYVCPSGEEDHNDFDLARTQLEAAGGVIERLANLGIAVTTLVDGDYVQPHFINQREGDSPSGALLSLTDAWEADPSSVFLSGYQVADDPASLICQELGCPVSEEQKEKWAFQKGPFDPEATFYESISLLGNLSLSTGGIFCPLTDRCQNSDPTLPGYCSASPLYHCPSPWEELDASNNVVGTPGTGVICRDPSDNALFPRVLNETCRGDNTVQDCATLDLSKSEQAVQCVEQAVAGNPFILVAEED